MSSRTLKTLMILSSERISSSLRTKYLNAWFMMSLKKWSWIPMKKSMPNKTLEMSSRSLWNLLERKRIKFLTWTFRTKSTCILLLKSQLCWNSQTKKREKAKSWKLWKIWWKSTQLNFNKSPVKKLPNKPNIIQKKSEKLS